MSIPNLTLTKSIAIPAGSGVADPIVVSDKVSRDGVNRDAIIVAIEISGVCPGGTLSCSLSMAGITTAIKTITKAIPATTNGVAIVELADAEIAMADSFNLTLAFTKGAQYTVNTVITVKKKVVSGGLKPITGSAAPTPADGVGKEIGQTWWYSGREYKWTGTFWANSTEFDEFTMSTGWVTPTAGNRVPFNTSKTGMITQSNGLLTLKANACYNIIFKAAAAFTGNGTAVFALRKVGEPWGITRADLYPMTSTYNEVAVPFFIGVVPVGAVDEQWELYLVAGANISQVYGGAYTVMTVMRGS